MLVFRGLDLVGERLCGAPLPGVTHVAVGRGDPAWGATPPAVPPTATALVDEVRRVRAEVSRDGATVVARASLPDGLTDLREIALFAGSMLVAYRRHAPSRAAELRLTAPYELIARLLAGEDIGPVTAVAGGARVAAALRYDRTTRTVVATARFGYAQGAAVISESALFAGDTLLASQTHAPIDRTRPRVLAQRFELALTTAAEIAVPAVTGKTVSEARSALEAAGLAVEIEHRVDADALTQSPEAGAIVHPGHIVALTAAAVAVPALAGASVQGAAAALAAAGLQLGASASEPSARPAGSVLRSDPPAGVLVERGAAVAIAVAAPLQVEVPDVRGQTAPVAAAMLTAAGLALADEPHATEESSADAGTILAQTPAAGALAAAGASVRVTLASGWTVVVPKVVGETDVATTLAAAGAELLARLGRPPQPPALVLGARHETESDVTPGSVIGQRPPAGTRVPLHQAVDIDVAVRRTVVVPTLAGRLQLDAVAAVFAAGLALGRIRSQMRKSGITAGTVVEQQPAEGLRVPADTIVDLVVSAPVLAPVPDVRGVPLAAAREVLDARGFGVGVITLTAGEPTDKGTIGEVASQAVPPRALQPLGSRIPVTVNKGTPTVLGLRFDAARLMLADVGISVIEPAPTVQSDAPPGTVLAQTPVGNKVTLTVAVAVEIPVPNLVGLAVEATTAPLGRLRLKQTGTVESDAIPGTIADQTPKPPAKLPPDGVVAVRLAIPKLPLEVVVPKLSGLTLAQAGAALEAAGLVLQLGGQEPSDKPAGSVIRHAPDAGAKVPRKSAVAVFVALSPDASTTVVPDVRTLSQAQAISRLETSHLIPVVEPRPTDEAAPETVLAQVPLGGVRVAAETQVTIEVASRPPIPMPDLLGLAESDARLVVTKLGLKYTRTAGGAGRAFVVVAQEPAAGTPVQKGQQVRVVTAR